MKTTRVGFALLGLGLMLGTTSAFAQYGQYAPPPPQYARAWNEPPAELREVERRGFVDGVQGAERDFRNHRIWSVDNRKEYVHPILPPGLIGEYREGFRHGYYETVRHYEHGVGPR